MSRPQIIEYRVQRVGFEGATLSGIAVPYDEASRMIYDRARPYRERFNRGALRIGDGVSLLYGHDPAGIPLARVGAGTLRFNESDEGLRFEADIPNARADLAEALERKDLDGSVSIGFVTRKDSWQNKTNPALRTVQEAVLMELSIVPAGAYSSARADLKGAL